MWEASQAGETTRLERLLEEGRSRGAQSQSTGAFVLGEVLQGPAWLQSPLFFDTPQS